jgi:hypothetical protein
MKDLRCMAKFLSSGISAAGEIDDIIPKHRVNRAMWRSAGFAPGLRLTLPL